MSAAKIKSSMPSEPQVRCIELVQRLIQMLNPRSEEYATAIMLAKELNQTVKCDRCGGRGTHPRHENCGHGTHDAYVRGCSEQVMCRKCRGDTVVPKPLNVRVSESGGDKPTT